METTHNITYEGLDLEVLGEFEEADNTTGCKGGWSTLDIKINGTSLYWFLKPEIIEHISELILNENY